MEGCVSICLHSALTIREKKLLFHILERLNSHSWIFMAIYYLDICIVGALYVTRDSQEFSSACLRAI